MGMMRDPVRYRSKHAPRAGHSPVADDDHLGILLVCDLHQRICRLAGPDVRLALNAARPKPLLRSIDVVLGTSSPHVLLVDGDRNSPGRPAHAVRALSVAAHDVELDAEQPR